MAERSIDRVLIELSPETIALPWSSRQALLAVLRRIEAMREVVFAFEAVGTSRPVQPTPEQKDDLHAVLGGWAQKTDGGYSGLPDGILELSNALDDDLHDHPPA